RKAERSGASYESGASTLTDFYQLYSKLMQREQISVEPKSFFSSFLDSKTNSTQVICAIVKFENQCEGALFVPYTQFMAYYLYGASSEQTKLVGSNKFLQAQTIKNLLEKGVRKYSLGGFRMGEKGITKKIEAIQNYKRRFGAELTEGFLWKANITSLGALYDFIFKIYCIVRYRTVFKDMIDQSETVIKNG
ncbi:MAG TPA: GNAT family N-acetyltransferase, partial [Bacteroidia bacterium]|nr:GNAT family N-acetyltransferase [Bacteroidia bacterium]